ncbi:MAG: glycosyltransferase family 4 protein [Patescibacteria group bacterium]
MRLLIVTQVVDAKDPILGFFVRWLEEFSKHAEQIEVVCLKEGTHSLPANVRVHSLGKEKGVSRMKYIFNFYTYIWELRQQYDTVFVHMNPEYLLLGGLFWRLAGKKIGFWYNHPHAGIRLRIAAQLSNKVFFTSPFAASATFPHAKRMPAGIDTDVFKPQPVPYDRQSLYMQGRVMPSKHLAVALEALQILRKTISAKLILVGPEDPTYGESLRIRFSDLVESGAVVFAGPKRNDETPPYYAAAGGSINLASAGHFDKSVLESMACETPVITSSPAFVDIISSEWVVKENDPPALAATLERLIMFPEAEYHALKKTLRARVVASHSLRELGIRLFAEMNI